MIKLTALLICLLSISSYQESKLTKANKYVTKSLSVTADTVMVCSYKWDSIQRLIEKRNKKK